MRVTTLDFSEKTDPEPERQDSRGGPHLLPALVVNSDWTNFSSHSEAPGDGLRLGKGRLVKLEQRKFSPASVLVRDGEFVEIANTVGLGPDADLARHRLRQREVQQVLTIQRGLEVCAVN